MQATCCSCASATPSLYLLPAADGWAASRSMGNATSHGSRVWQRAGSERRVVLSSFQSKNLDFPSREGGSWGRAFRHPLLVPSL